MEMRFLDDQLDDFTRHSEAGEPSEEPKEYPGEVEKGTFDYESFTQEMRTSAIRNSPGGGYIYISGQGIKEDTKIGFGQGMFFAEIPTKGKFTIDKLLKKVSGNPDLNKQWLLDLFVPSGLVIAETNIASQEAQRANYRITLYERASI